MDRPHLAIYKDEKGKLTILEMGVDADPVIDAYKQCDKPGSTYLYHNVLPTKSKKLRGEDPPKKKATKKAPAKNSAKD
jgi:hypothetical protein